MFEELPNISVPDNGKSNSLRKFVNALYPDTDERLRILHFEKKNTVESPLPGCYVNPLKLKNV
jgi:hypothetical protein